MNSYALGLLTSTDDVASQASIILKDLISSHIDTDKLLAEESLSCEDEDNVTSGDNVNAAKCVCSVFESALNSCDGIPKEQILTVIDLLIEKLGRCTFTRVLCYVILNMFSQNKFLQANNLLSKKLIKIGVNNTYF